jgi:hypothetical protein
MNKLISAFAGTGILLLGGLLWCWHLPQEARTSTLIMRPLDQAAGFRIRSNQFSKQEEEGEGTQLSYFWWDHADNPYSVVFSLANEDIRQSEDEFGYFPRDLAAYLEPRLEPLQTRYLKELRKHVLKLLAKSPYGHYYYIEDDALLSFNLKIMAPPSLPESESNKVKEEFQKIVSAVAKKQEPYIKKIQAEEQKVKRRYLETRGFRLEGNSLFVNYSWVIRRNKDRVRSLVGSLRRETKGSSLQEFLSLLLAFVQSMGYGTPPLDEADKVILGFWPPPKVLVNNYGDCDSKGALFASIWTQFRRFPLLLIRIPKHLFIGVAIPSFQGRDFTINGLRYTFCEVTGPELIPPGFLNVTSLYYLERGGYHYEQIR